MTPIPVIALTGYLGAGKTTLLNQLLRSPGARVGVVVNDFGAINIDAGLVMGQIDEPASIAGGCICCLPDAGGLDDALARLSRPKLALDAVVVEASGIAEPVTLSRLIRSSPVPRVRPGGVIDVVDTTEFFRTLDTGESAPARFAVATLAVLNKTDRLPPSARTAVLDRIRERIWTRNPHVTVVESSYGRIDPDLVFDAARAIPPDQLPIDSLFEHEHEHEHADAVAVRVESPVDPAALADLLEQPPCGIYRMKGTVVVQAGARPRRFAVDLVGRTVHVRDLPVGRRDSEVVAIGMHLDVAAVRTRLELGLTAVLAPAGDGGLRRLERHRRLSA